jgi:hypothetical protein
MPVMWRRGARTWVLVWALAAGACSTQSASTADAKSDRPPAGSAQSTQSVPPGGYEGFLEVVSCDILSGWAWSPSQPANPLTIDLYDGDRLLTTVSADIFRQDLMDTGKGDGRHQFSQRTPVGIRDGQPHAIRALVKGTSFTLPRLEGAPVSIMCEP